MNRCLYGCPIDTCNENKRAKSEGNSCSENGKSTMGWLSSVDEKMSLIALAIGLGVGFGGVIFVFVVWEKARCWVVPTKRPQTFYGEYRLPK